MTPRTMRSCVMPFYQRFTAFILGGLLAVLALPTPGVTQTEQPQTITPEIQAVLDRISADSMRGHLSFIASDRLEGRDTPSRGLDIAAEYIAAQFRRAGLEPAGDDGYFQTAPFVMTELDKSSFQLTLRSGDREVHASAEQVSFAFGQDWTVEPTAVVKIRTGDTAALDALPAGEIEGKAVLMERPRTTPADPTQRATLTAFVSRVQAQRPAVIVNIVRSNPSASGGGPPRLVDPENRVAGNFDRFLAQNRSIDLQATEAVVLYDALPEGLTTATLSLKARGLDRPTPLRNVVAILRGSDPALANTFVFLTAHYDHVGIRPNIQGDNIFNGANDDGSGTVSVIEIASALTTLKEKPRRSLVFMTVFGEEKGMLGSQYYLRHPIIPIDKTIADVNLEQVGRTDSTEGPQVDNATITGFDFSDIAKIFSAAGMLTGIRVYKHERNSDPYFSASDNAAFAIQGVPAHSLSVAFDYPDYHKAGDHWEKVDYSNMARVDRMVALGLLMIANSPVEPKWDELNPKTAPYVSAWKAGHPGTPQ